MRSAIVSALPPVAQPFHTFMQEEHQGSQRYGGGLGVGLALAKRLVELHDGTVRAESAGHGGSLKWTHATDAAAAANFGVWKLYFEQAGLYRVEAHTPAPWAMSKQTVYQIEHSGQSTAADVDQTAVDGWTAIADLEFACECRGGLRVLPRRAAAQEQSAPG